MKNNARRNTNHAYEWHTTTTTSNPDQSTSQWHLMSSGRLRLTVKVAGFAPETTTAEIVTGDLSRTLVISQKSGYETTEIRTLLPARVGAPHGDLLVKNGLATQYFERTPEQDPTVLQVVSQ